MRQSAKHADLSNLPPWEFDRIKTMALAAIHRITGENSIYARQADEARKVRPQDNSPNWESYKRVFAILASLRDALANNYLDNAAELIHASVFADFLEMCRYLLDDGYKDPAAVIAGSSLEAHLRELCSKHGIEVTDNGGKFEKSDRVNAELTKAKA